MIVSLARSNRDIRCLPVALSRRCSFSHAEIRQPCASAGVEQHVARLQIAMHDSPLVRVLQRLRHFEQRGNNFQEPGTAQTAQIATGGKLHRKDHRIAGALRRKHLQYGRMIETSCNLILVLERLPHLSTRGAGGL